MRQMDDPPADDADLLGRFAHAGDQAAFAQVVARHQDLVRRACLRRLSPADAEDAAQAVFIILSRKPAEAVRHGCLPAWLQRTVHHVAGHAVRGRASRHAAETRASQEARMSSDPEPAQVEDPERLRGQLDAAVERLPEAQRQVVVLHYFSGLDHEAVARELGCPINTVYTRLHRALAKLRGLLAPDRADGLSASAVGVLLADSGRLTLPQLPPIDPHTASATAHGLASTTLHGMLMTKIALFAAGIVLPITCAIAGVMMAAEHPAPPVIPPAPQAAAAAEPSGVPAMVQVPELVPDFGVTPEVEYQDFNHRGDGLAVASVTDGKTGARLGIKAGDVLLRLNGRAIDNLNLLRRVEAATRPGETIAVDLLRDGRAVTLNGVMGGRARTDDEIPLPFARFRDSDPLRMAFYWGADPSGYEADHDPAEPGSLRYRAVVAAPKGINTWMTGGPRAQRLQQLIGKRVRFSAEIRTVDIAQLCGLWIRADRYIGDTDYHEVASFDNMRVPAGRAITGTTPWRRHAVVVDLPAGTTALKMGVNLDGLGSIWLRDVVLEEVDATVASTSMQQECDELNFDAKQRWEDAQRKKATSVDPAATPKEAF